jgi:hypothetical protein
MRVLAWVSVGLVAVAACATSPPRAAMAPADTSTPRIAITETTPGAGSEIAADTRLSLVADYALADFAPGKDRITVVLKAQDGKTWEPVKLPLAKAQGQVSFTLVGSELLDEPSLVRPFQLLLELDREESATSVHTLKATSLLVFPTKPTAAPSRPGAGPPSAQAAPAGEEGRFLPPSRGKAQLVSDMVNDPRYRPHLPKELATAGSVYWALFKICVDAEGKVQGATTLKSAHPDIDPTWLALIRTLEHRPYTVEGKPAPFCYPLRVEVRVRDE